MIRIIGNLLLLFGHTILLFQSIEIGIIIKLISNVLLCYFFIKEKYYDMVVTLVAFAILEMFRLVYL